MHNSTPAFPCTIRALVGEGFLLRHSLRWTIVSSMKSGIALIRCHHVEPRR